MKSASVKQYIETTWPVDEETRALIQIEDQDDVADALGVSQPLVSGVLQNISRDIIQNSRLRARRYYEENPDTSYRGVRRRSSARKRVDLF